MDQPGQASRTGRNGQEQFQVDDTLQNGLPVITDNRYNEVFLTPFFFFFGAIAQILN